jgi:hypothetical protein
MSTPFIYGESSNLTVGGSLIPGTDVMYNLGSTTKRWRDLYLSGNTINIGGTTISRQEDGSIGITDTLAVGGPTPATLKVSKIMSATGDIINMSGATLSNVSIAANKIKVTGIPEPSYIAPELRILNEDTSSGLVVNQTGQTSAGVAEFQDHGISALNIAKGGSITVGNLLLPDEIPVQSTVTTTSTELSTAGMEQQSINTEIVASDGSTVELFGRATSTSDDGKSFIVGAPLDSFGSAYIYKWNGATWVETKLTPSDGVAGNNFGTSVAMSADGLTVAVGAPGPETAPGAVYVYKYSGSTWVETKKAADFTNVDVSSYLYDSVWASTPFSHPTYWKSVCWAPELNLFVAVGEPTSTIYGDVVSVQTSTNGKTWTSVDLYSSPGFYDESLTFMPYDITWSSVCWSPQLLIFVAVGQNGVNNRVMTSVDGNTWTSRTSASNASWKSVCWSPQLTLFVAVASSTTGYRVMTSPDGVLWTLQATPADNTWNSVCWSPELMLFVAVSSTGTGNRVMTSPDGIVWTIRAPPSYAWWSVCWSPELALFVAVGTASVMTSPDGFVWQQTLQFTGYIWVSVCWAKELALFIAVARLGGTVGNRIMTSPDGYTWTQSTGVWNLLQFTSVCWAPQLSLIVTVSNPIYDPVRNQHVTSTNGINWEVHGLVRKVLWTSVCWSPELTLFVSCADGGNESLKAYSSDGVSWTESTPVGSGGSTAVCWSPELSLFVAGPSGEKLFTSENGKDWTVHIIANQYVNSICWSSELNIFVMVGTYISTSSDGITWAPQSSPFTQTTDWKHKSVCWAAELSLFVVVGQYGAMTSPDGVNWTIRDTTFGSPSVCWSPELSLLVAINYDSLTTCSSPDGITWTTYPTGIGATDIEVDWISICWSPELMIFLVMGIGGIYKAMTSPDGITWTLRASDNRDGAFGGFHYAICWSSELLRFVAVGNGNVMSSSSSATILITPTPTSTGNSYGNALALSKDAATLAVGAPNTKIYSPLKQSAGAAYVYKWNGSAWGAQTLLQASDIIDSQKFGVSIAASTNGTSIAVGSELGTGAYVYKLVNSAWTETKAIASEPIVAADGYSTSCAISADGTRFVIGAPGKGTNAGAAYIYEWSGSAWVETKLMPTVAGSGFGQSVAMLGDGNSVLIGEVFTNSNTGDAYFFMRTNGTWTEGTKLVAPNAEAGDKFGTSVALSSQYAFVGATSTDAAAADQGSVYVFNYGPALVPQEITVTTTTNVTTMVSTGPAIKVIGSALFDGDVDVQGTHTASSLNVSNAGTGTAMTINQSNVTQPIVDFKDDGLTVFKIVPGGNIGVGTTLPAYKLHVVGTTFSSAGFMSYSDSSLKTNVQEIKGADALSIVSQMRGVRYDRIKKEEDPRRRVGLIAQEVECVLPEIVRTDANGMKSVAYGDSVAVLIQAIKEQQKEIDALKILDPQCPP